MFQIKNWVTGKVQFECELSAEYQNKEFRFQLGFAIKNAVELKTDLRGADLRGADLRGADLRGADLQGAYLRGADLRGADLRGADLQGADLQGADLQGADLQGADLQGADLQGADLQGAYLQGAYLQEYGKLIGKRPIIQIGGIGSEERYLIAYNTEKGIIITTGCFTGTVKEFNKAVEAKHDNNINAQEYKAAVTFIKTHNKLWNQNDKANPTK